MLRKNWPGPLHFGQTVGVFARLIVNESSGVASFAPPGVHNVENPLSGLIGLRIDTVVLLSRIVIICFPNCGRTRSMSDERGGPSPHPLQTVTN